MPYLVSLAHVNAYSNELNYVVESFDTYESALDHFLELHNYRKCGLVTYTLNSKRDFQDMECDNYDNDNVYYADRALLKLMKYEKVNIPKVVHEHESELVCSVVESFNALCEHESDNAHDYELYHKDSLANYKYHMCDEAFGVQYENSQNVVIKILSENSIVVANINMEKLMDKIEDFTKVISFVGYYGTMHYNASTYLCSWVLSEIDTMLPFTVPNYVNEHKNFWYDVSNDYLVVGIVGGFELHVVIEDLLDIVADME